MKSPSQIVVFRYSGSVVKSTGDISSLSIEKTKNLSIFKYFPLIENLLPSITNDQAKETSIKIPRIESDQGLMKGRIYDLSIKKMERGGKKLLKCVIEDFTERYEQEIRDQQKRHEKDIRQQTRLS